MKTIGPHDELVQILAEAIRRLGASRRLNGLTTRASKDRSLEKISKSPLTLLDVPPKLRLHVSKREEDK